MLKTIYLNSQNATLRPDGEALRVKRPNKSDSLIPLRRVDRAIIQHSDADLLQACLTIIHNGGTVHFEDSAGNLCGVLKQPWPEGTRWAHDIAHTIECTSGSRPYRQWLDDQRRHAWSLVCRGNYHGSFDSNRHKLLKYLFYFCPGINASNEVEWLEQQLWAWLQARLQRDGLQPIVRALRGKEQDITQDLVPCLYINLLWSFVRWRRHQDTAMISERTRFFELQARTRMANQLHRHIQALEFRYHKRNCVDQTDYSELGRPESLT